MICLLILILSRLADAMTDETHNPFITGAERSGASALINLLNVGGEICGNYLIRCSDGITY